MSDRLGARCDAFLSYARADDEAFVKDLERRLTDKGFAIWLDRADMPNRGEAFLREIQRAIDLSDRVIAVIGPHAVSSPYVRSEWDYAQLVCKVVVPVLRCGASRDAIPAELRTDDYTLIPPELRRFHCPDFRPPRSQDDALDELERILRQPVIEPGKPLHVPALPPHFLPRRDVLERLGAALLADAFQPITLDEASKQTAVLRGAAGTGKSVMAAAIARSISIRRSFSDGVVWLRVGQNPDLRAQLSLLVAGLGGDHEHSSLKEMEALLPELLEDKRCLIVLDDVWHLQHVEPVWNALGVRCRLLVSTRLGELATCLHASECVLDTLTRADSLALLSNWVEQPQNELPAIAHDVARECGHLPLALALCGALVQDKTPWADLLAALQAADLTFVSHDLVNYEHAHVMRAMRVSVDFLARQQPDAPSRYAELAVFWPSRLVPETAVLTMWCRDGVTSERTARRLLAEFDRKSLLGLEGEVPERLVWLHDLAWGYVRSVTSQIDSLDSELLEAYDAKCASGWPSGPNDGYFFERLIHHLLRAKHRDTASALLGDFEWLSRELGAAGVDQILADLERVAPSHSAWHEFFDGNAHRLRRKEPEPGVHLVQLATVLAHDDPIRRAAGWYVERGNVSSHWLHVRHGRGSRPIPLVRVCEGAFEPQCSLSFTPGGDRIISVGAYLHVWETKNGSLLHRHHVDGDRFPRAVGAHPDGRRAFTGDLSGTVSIWDLETGKSRAMEGPKSPPIRAIAVHPDGDLVVSGDDDGRVMRWDIRNARASGVLASHDSIYGNVRSVVFDPTGRLVMTASWDRTVRVIDLSTGRVIHQLRGHHERVNAAVFHPDGQHAVSAGEDDTLKVWNLRTGECVRTLRGDGHMAVTLAMHPDGRRVVSGGVDRAVCVWDIDEERCGQRFEGHHDYLQAVALHPDGNWVVSSSKDKTVRLWHLETSRASARSSSHRRSVNALAIDPRRRLAASASGDGDLRVWDLGTGTCLETIEAHEQAFAIAFHPNGNLISGGVDATGEGCAIRVWAPSSSGWRSLGALVGHPYRIYEVAMHPDDRRALSLCGAGLRVWDLNAGRCLKAIDAKSQNRLAVHPDGRRVITAGEYEPVVRVWDINTGNCARELVGHNYGVNRLALHPDGRRLITAGRDYKLLVWSLDSGERLHCLSEEHVMPMQAVAIQPTGRLAISGAMNGSVAVWDLESGERIQQLAGHWGSVNEIMTSSDGRFVVSAGWDHHLRVWNPITGRRLATWSADAPVECCALAGDTIVAGTAGGEVIVADLIEPGVPVTMPHHDGSPPCRSDR